MTDPAFPDTSRLPTVDDAGRGAARRVAVALATLSGRVSLALLALRLVAEVIPPLGRTFVGEIRPLGSFAFVLFAVVARDLARPRAAQRRARSALVIVALAVIGLSAWLPGGMRGHGGLADWLTSGTMLASRFTAFGLVLASLGLAELWLRERPRFFQIPAFALVVFGVTGVLGFAIARHELAQVWIYDGVHFAGTLGQTILGICLLGLRPEAGFVGTLTRTDPTGALVRRMALGSVLIPLLSWAVDGLGSDGVGLWGDHFGIALTATLHGMLFVGLLWVAVETLARTAHARREAEVELERARGAYRHIVETMGEGVVSFDRDFRIAFANRRMSEMLGFSQQELIGRRVQDLFPAEDRDINEERLSRRRQGIAETFDQRLWRKDGSLVWAIVSSNPTLDAHGRFAGSLSTFTDITARRSAEEALRESEERFQQIAAHVSELFWIRQREPERVLYVSPAFERIWGIPARVLDRNPRAWLDSIHPADLEAVKSALAARGHEPSARFDVRYRVVRRDGSVRWVHDRGQTIAGRGGAPERLVSIATDVTDEVMSEERRALLMSELDHRVKNTLATVVALLDLTLDKQGTIEELREALTSRIYAMARTHEGLARHKWEAMPVLGVAKLALAPWLSFPSQRIRLDGPPIRLPSAIATPISLALNELATNSLKYGALATTEGRVEVAWSGAAGQTLEISWVERDGPAVSAPPRLGTGLTLLQDLIDYQLHGSFAIEFEPAGVRATLRFPLPGGKPDSDSSVGRKTPPTTLGVGVDPDGRALAGVRVLVVEDDQLQARMLARLLSRLGCEVVELSSTAQAALVCIEQEKLDGAVLDVNLGSSSSCTVADALLTRGIPFFFVSGYARVDVLPPHLAELPRLGKPVEPAALAAFARKHFGRGA